MSRLKRIGAATSQWLNVAVFNGQVDETISARAYRQELSSHSWAVARKLIDKLFTLYETEHCRKSYESERLRKHLPTHYRNENTR